MKTILFVITVCFASICCAQDRTIDTVAVDGYLVTFAEKKTPRHAIDQIRGYFFFTENPCGGRPEKMQYEDLFQLDRRQNAVFLLGYGGNFVVFNSLFFHGAMSGMIAPKSFYPSVDDYSFKDKKYRIKCTPMRVRALRLWMVERELIRFIAFDQYTFKSDKVPVYIIQGMIE